MPIRFYCPFCDQLLGIASRKAGSAVTCPRCGGEVGVPRPGPGATPPPGGLVLSPNGFGLLVLAALASLGLAFLAGLLVGGRARR